MPVALPLQQHPQFATALRQMGRDVRLINLPDAHPVVAVQVLGQLIASRGPIWAADASPTKRSHALARSGLRFLNAESNEHAALAAAGFRKLATAGTVAELCLCSDASARLAATHGKWRNQWRRAQQAPVTLRQERFDRSNHQWLLDADIAQQRQKRFRGLPHILIDALATENAVNVHVAYLDATPVAALLFIMHPPVVTYHIGWTSPEGRRWGLHHRLILDAAATFADQAYCRLDLGSVDTENAPGLARFKIGTGAQLRSLGGSWMRFGFMRR